MIRTLIVGGGSIGERHLRCFQQTGRADVALCEINEELRGQLTDRYQLTQTFASLDEGLLQPFDAVVICTPAHLHIPMARQALDAGASILIEKPLSTTLDGIDELQQALDRTNRPASVAYVYRAHPGVIAMKQAIDSGRFGRPVQITSVSGQHFPLYRPAYREIYYTRRETGGGAIQDALTHVLNAAEWLVGPVTRLAADADHCVLEGVEVEDTVNVVTRHGSVLGSFSLNQHQPPNESNLTVICENGAVRFQMHRHRWLSCVEPGAEWQVEETFSLERDHLFVRQADAFLDVIETGSAPACTVAEALQTLRVNLAVLQAADEQRWVTVD
ncbi:Inositol 2-dehydrogenase/D-chiro-inositol 3-dehydrogenase [Maioricimonas rarisocia]|uniref:Inositol 2-dehydrogenase/D-chiro-inositol 3-dehydrogenase n=1 Tax=Maioricimonas rarisocia TaxID=2528026 RepID=A0A517ZGA4_9PLAN|nr:Gfo/Idh/MocA family oxidoreductase [Maioricimonas rarisocia]QDU41494.1 Inositol 2-dehydrogenase/D-chiro-inositol 3-dehydrogenase [Maioricimonas rarisocia]